MKRSVNVTVYKEKAYLPTLALTSSGVYQDVDPVRSADLTVPELAAAIQSMFRAGNPLVRHPSQEELRPSASPILKASGARSWRALAEGGAAYDMSWEKDGSIILYISTLDKKGRFVWDASKTRRFPSGTPTEELARAILEDAGRRSNLTGGSDK